MGRGGGSVGGGPSVRRVRVWQNGCQGKFLRKMVPKSYLHKQGCIQKFFSGGGEKY